MNLKEKKTWIVEVKILRYELCYTPHLGPQRSMK